METGSKPRVCFEFEVEKVIGISSDGNYQVQWAPAWVSKLILVGCEHLIEEFLQEQAEKEMKREPESPLEVVDDILQVDYNQSGHSFEVTENESNNQLALPPLTFVAVDVKVENTDCETDTPTAVEQNSLPFDLNTNGLMNRTTTSNNESLGYHCEYLEAETCEDKSSTDGDLEKDHTDPLSLTTCIQNNTYPYSCDQCSFSCTQKVQFTTHLRTHIGKKTYSCNQCGYFCIQKNDLAKHMHTHAGLKSFRCEVCGKCFTLKTNLNKHQRIHTGDKPYSCTHCAHSCSHKSDLVKHMRTHTGEKPYSCDLCGKTFARSDNCRSHTNRCTNTAKHSYDSLKT